MNTGITGRRSLCSRVVAPERPAGPPEGARWLSCGWMGPTAVTRGVRGEGLRPQGSAGRGR
jgi:hypothetical protein